MYAPAEHLPNDQLGAPVLTSAEEAHLAICARCRVDRRRLADFESLASNNNLAETTPGPAPLAPGTVVDDTYEIGEVIGRGGMGIVYAAEHRVLGSHHAIKFIHLTDRTLSKRLLREGQLQARLEHTHIVRVTDVVALGDALGLVMEYVRGPSLDQLIADGELSTWALRDDLAKGILRGVRAAHQQGWIHRDLKPANILLAHEDDAYVPKIADFGLARLVENVDGALTRPGTILGTPAYMAPEQFTAPSTVDAQADVFALGAILYEMCTGSRAFRGASIQEIGWQITGGRYTPVREAAPDIPVRMERAITGALQVQREDRFATCQALLDVWRGGPAGDEVTESAPRAARVHAAAPTVTATSFDAPTQLPAPLRPTRTRRVTGALGALLAACALLAYATWPDPVVEPPVPAPPAAPDLVRASMPTPVPIPLPVAAPVPPPVPPPVTEPKSTRRVPVPPPPVRGSVRVTGDAKSVVLVSGDTRFSPGEVLPGTYGVLAVFPEWGERMTDVRVVVIAGGDHVVNCVAAFTQCKQVK